MLASLLMRSIQLAERSGMSGAVNFSLLTKPVGRWKYLHPLRNTSSAMPTGLPRLMRAC